MDNKKERRSEEELRGRIDYLFETGVITAEAMNFMRGRSITETWLMIDEAQNLSPRQVKGVITRVGSGTKVILVGDPAQIDNPLLNERSNGLSYAAERMKGSPLCVQLTCRPTSVSAPRWRPTPRCGCKKHRAEKTGSLQKGRYANTRTPF